MRRTACSSTSRCTIRSVAAQSLFRSADQIFPTREMQGRFRVLVKTR